MVLRMTFQFNWTLFSVVERCQCPIQSTRLHFHTQHTKPWGNRIDGRISRPGPLVIKGLKYTGLQKLLTTGEVVMDSGPH